ncbi:hypothetical protein VMCG_09786 [Cytospora schulzeri]|uniref:DUF946 domain-containing protein n=1 Tax=Cytospora schulzeri TaxID=448051 RepID=A0A423VGN4_9PEZI|nr:hypothetical protein VMCG_09786 [Valsa malicola]
MEQSPLHHTIFQRPNNWLSMTRRGLFTFSLRGLMILPLSPQSSIGSTIPAEQNAAAVTSSLSEINRTVPDYVTRYAPLVWLHSEDPFRPSDILQHVRHTTPMVQMEPIARLPELDLDNLALLNERFEDDGQVALTAKDDITKLPAWLFGETPDESGKIPTAVPCVVILVESEKDSSHTDAFYFYFYSYNRGANVTQTLPPIKGLLEDSDMDHKMHFEDHVGDWEHNMIRFHKGKPTGIYYSQHEGGSAYNWDDTALSIENARPVVYSAYGSHANYVSSGDQVHDEVLLDYCDAGQLWDPVSSAYFYRLNPVTLELTRIFSPGNPEASNLTSFLYFAGRWGDVQYPDSHPLQKTVPYFGLKRYVSGPTGPTTKQLVRKGLFPDHRGKKSWLQYYEDIMWAQLGYIKANYPNAEVIFKNGNYGFMLVLSNIRKLELDTLWLEGLRLSKAERRRPDSSLCYRVRADFEKGYFCYIMESTYLLTYTLHIAMSIYGVWASHRRTERIYVMLSKIVPPILAGVTIGLEYTRAVQRSWTVYMVVANLQTVAACTFSIILIAMILWKYVDSKSLWKNIKTGPMVDGSSVSWKVWILKSLRSRNSSSTSARTPRARDHMPKVLLDNSWLVWRLSIAIVLISAFILATVLTQLPTPGQMALEVKTDAPDLSASHARGNIVGYIYGVTPGLAIPIVFGLTRPFRQTLYKTFVPKRWQKRNQAHWEQTKQAGGWEARPTAHSLTPESLQLEAPRSWAPGTLGGRPGTAKQDRTKRMNTGLVTDSDDSSYELNVGTSGRHETPGPAGVKNAAVRPGFSGSTASLDPLLEDGHPGDEAE